MKFSPWFIAFALFAALPLILALFSKKGVLAGGGVIGVALLIFMAYKAGAR